jgi:hypothetical protein
MREVLCSILIKFGIPIKLIMLIKMCLNEICSKVCIGEYLSDALPFQNGLTQGCLIATEFQVCLKICHQEGPRKSGWLGIE